MGGAARRIPDKFSLRDHTNGDAPHNARRCDAPIGVTAEGVTIADKVIEWRPFCQVHMSPIGRKRTSQPY
jgi:hypothetical protein